MIESSSSEDESDLEPSVPLHLLAATTTPAGPRPRSFEEDAVSRGSNLYSRPTSVDQQSISAVSRLSGCSGSTDNLSLAGTSACSSQFLYHPAGGGRRSVSPSPSLMSDRGAECSSVIGRDDEEERRRRLLLYVFVIRCIAYPFNAKQPTDMVRRQTKVTAQQLQMLKDRFQVLVLWIVRFEKSCPKSRSLIH